MSTPSIPPSVLNAAAIARSGGAMRISTRLLMAAAHPVKTAVMSSPITITKGADNASSSLVASATVGFASATGIAGASVQVTDPRMTALRGTWAISGGSGRLGDGVTRGTGQRSGINGQGFAFCMSGTAFDVSLLGGTNTGNDSKMNVRVTHLATGARELINATDFVVSNAAAAYYLVSGLAAGPKIIEVYFGRRVFVRGFNVAPTDTIWKAPVRSGLNTAALGDSYIDGPTTDTLCGGYVWHLAEALGIENIRLLGISQSGWVAAPNGASWLYRIQNGDLDAARIGTLDVLFIHGSINDNGSSDAAVSAAMLEGLALIKQKQPHALVIHAGPQFTGAAQTPLSRYAAMKTAFESVYPVGSRGVWIDNSPSGAPWMTGTGHTGATAGNGNNDLCLDTDNTHWNAAGHRFGGNRFGAAVVEALRGLPY